MADQCVPSSNSAEETAATVRKCSINLRRRRSRTEKETSSHDQPQQAVAKRKKKSREDQRELYSRVQDVKGAHKRAKRSRPLVKDKRREIHRQNERFRHQSLNLAISELAELVPKTDHRSVDTKHNIVQRTGDYMEYLNDKVSAMCKEVRVTKQANSNSLVFNKQLTVVINDHKKNYPAAKPVSFSDLEGLLENMHIDSRVYTTADTHRKPKSRRDPGKMRKASKKSWDKRKIKNKDILPNEGDSRSMVIGRINPARTPFLSPPASHPGLAVGTPRTAMPGYLGDGEESASSCSWTTSSSVPSTSTLSQLSALSQESSELESEAADDGTEDEAVTTVTGPSIIGNDHCYSSSYNYHSDPSEAMPFLLPSVAFSGGTSLVGVEPGCSADGIGLGHLPSEPTGTETAAVSAVIAQECTSTDETLASIARLMSLPSSDGNETGELVPMDAQDLERLPAVVQLVMPMAEGPNVELQQDKERESQRLLAVGSGSSAMMSGGLQDTPADREVSVQEIDPPGDAASCNQSSLDDGYQFFFRVNLPNFQQAWPRSDDLSLRKLLTQAWDDLPGDVRQIYVDKALEWEGRASHNQQHLPEQ